MQEIANLVALHTASHQMHKHVAATNGVHRTHSQKIHSSRTNILHLNITITDFVMVRAHTRREDELQFNMARHDESKMNVVTAVFRN